MSWSRWVIWKCEGLGGSGVVGPEIEPEEDGLTGIAWARAAKREVMDVREHEEMVGMLLEAMWRAAEPLRGKKGLSLSKIEQVRKILLDAILEVEPASLRDALHLETDRITQEAEQAKEEAIRLADSGEARAAGERRVLAGERFLIASRLRDVLG